MSNQLQSVYKERSRSVKEIMKKILITFLLTTLLYAGAGFELLKTNKYFLFDKDEMSAIEGKFEQLVFQNMELQFYLAECKHGS